MELSLFSRDVIAMATPSRCRTTCSTRRCAWACATRSCRACSSARWRSATCRRCSCPAGPMPSGLPNEEKARVRQLYAEGKVGREELLEAEIAELPPRRHLHLLRHRQQQPDADGGDGPAPAGRRLRHSEHAAARCADRRRRAARRAITALGGEYHAARPGGRRAGHRQRHRRRCWRPAARPTTRSTWWRWRAPPASASTGTISATVGRRAAAGAHLSERQGRREPVPRRRRHGLPDPRIAGGRAAARGRRRPWSARASRAYAQRAVARRRRLRWRDAPAASGDAACCARSAIRSAPTAG